jgi:hypothetical protein
MRRLVVALIVFALTAGQLFAASAPDPKHIETIKKKVSSCLENSRHVTIETYDGRKLQGSVSEADADSFVLTFHNNSTTLSYADVKRIKWPSPISKTGQAVIVASAVVGGLLLAVVLLGGLKG